MISSVGGDA